MQLIKHTPLDERLYEYLKAISLRESDIEKQLRKETDKLPLGIMQIAPEQGALMTLLVQLMGAKNYLEVGTFTGYSALCVALALPADGKVIACDVSEEYTRIARDYWEQAGVANKIDLRLAPALETLEQLLTEGQANTFDFAFIDADKLNYDGYYERILKLVRHGGLIAIDNVLWSGKVAEPKNLDPETLALRNFNAKLQLDERITLCVLPISDGLTLAVKR